MAIKYGVPLMTLTYPVGSTYHEEIFYHMPFFGFIVPSMNPVMDLTDHFLKIISLKNAAAI